MTDTGGSGELRLPAAWGAGTAVAALLVIGLGLAGSYHGGIIGALLLAGLAGTAGVLPAYGLARAWRARDHRTPGWLVHLAAALAWSATLSLLTSAVLLRLPHGWGTALSWSDVRLRTTWIGAVVTPSALGAYAVTLPVVRSRAGDPRRGGRHR